MKALKLGPGTQLPRCPEQCIYRNNNFTLYGKLYTSGLKNTKIQTAHMSVSFNGNRRFGF